MSEKREDGWRLLPAAVLLAQAVAYAVGGLQGWLAPFAPFTLLLLAANAVIVGLYLRRGGDFVVYGGLAFIVASHGVLGQRLAPDSLTSGAMLMVNILVFYVGVKISQTLPWRHLAAFAGSYLLLYYLFIVKMENAEALFLLALLGLAATGRDFRLLAYFWALALSFTFCQPYAWQAALGSFFLLKAAFSLPRGRRLDAAGLFLGVGFALVFLVLLPVLALLFGEDVRNLANTLESPRVRDALWMTLATASATTAVLAVVLIPFAYALARRDFFGKALLLSVIDIPVVIPQSAAGLAILSSFGRHQYLGELLFSATGLRVDGAALGICLAQAFVAMPFLVKGSMAAFEAVPPALEDAARLLGASGLGAFLRVAVPIAAKGLLASLALTWARAAGEFGAVLFVAPFPETAPIAVYNRFASVGVAESAPLVSTLLLFSLAMFFLLRLAERLAPTIHRPTHA